MKRGLKRASASAGFTIVETMIVLAVTGILFVVIATTWSGRQHKSEFAAASQETRSVVQQVISEVQAGYFPATSNFKCHASGSGIALDFTATSEQGENTDCVFLGKVIQFAMKDTDPEQYRTYSIAGKRSTSAASLTSINPTALAPTAGGLASHDLSDAKKQMYGLTTVAMKVKTGAGSYTDVGAIGFLSRIGSYDGDGNLASGTQQLDLYALKTKLAEYPDSPSAADAVNDALNNSSKHYVNQPVYICFKSGGTNQYALVTVGDDSSNLTADLKITDDTDCGL